ncbi:tripartite tricarboxylate transporter TctB family protein [Paracraurococcus lichenis]|uniref:Tripartite tricarboxylate transporter TctB family protein n=1 Tax=Paracraurococcus lichenis TaxID=3064888 RepID=A0ABT9DUD2_9PROT|nr:tripartite tricarboxylate transporter TctB family protein [Paracraurococcus sp. LOR1-02]MDO9707493.1 tripartite tricarboxylate transporter TctB family protein [Paracraurococcus sp. LOR1-02]
MHLSDRVTGAVLVALGGAAALGGSRLPAVPGQDVGPAAFPMLIGFGLVLCGGLIALGIGSSFEVPEEEAAGPGPWRLGGLRALVPPALLLFYVLASEPLGFLLTAAIMVLVGALALGARPVLAVPLALAMPPLIHLAFYKLLRVPLPAGVLPAPW